MKIAYLAGLPRTGSTLLLNLLGQNPLIVPSPTSPLFDLLLGMGQQYSTSVSAKAYTNQERVRVLLESAQRGAIQSWADEHQNKDSEIYIDKNRGWVSQFSNLESIGFKEPKMIITIRDIRGILASMETLWQSRRDLTMAAQVLLPTVGERCQKWLQMDEAPLGISLSRLMEVLRNREAANMLFVRAEDLTSSTVNTLTSVLSYLDLPFFNDFNLSNIKQITHEIDNYHAPFGDHKVKSTIVPLRRDWSNIIGNDVSSYVLKEFQWFYHTFYPELQE